MEGQEKTVRGIKTFLKTLVTVVLLSSICSRST